MAQSQVIFHLLDASALTKSNSTTILKDIQISIEMYPEIKSIVVLNKIDLVNSADVSVLLSKFKPIKLSAKTGTGLEALKSELLGMVHTGKLHNNDTIISNARHYDALEKAQQSILTVLAGLESNLSGDLLAVDLREALYHFGRITGEISTDDLLGNIFDNFCIGK